MPPVQGSPWTLQTPTLQPVPCYETFTISFCPYSRSHKPIFKGMHACMLVCMCVVPTPC